MNLIRPICIYLAFNNLYDNKILNIKVKKLIQENTKLLHYFGNNYKKKHNLNKDEYNDFMTCIKYKLESDMPSHLQNSFLTNSDESDFSQQVKDKEFGQKKDIA